jgi:hypothetical protein
MFQSQGSCVLGSDVVHYDSTTDTTLPFTIQLLNIVFKIREIRTVKGEHQTGQN